MLKFDFFFQLKPNLSSRKSQTKNCNFLPASINPTIVVYIFSQITSQQKRVLTRLPLFAMVNCTEFRTPRSNISPKLLCFVMMIMMIARSCCCCRVEPLSSASVSDTVPCGSVPGGQPTVAGPGAANLSRPAHKEIR